MTEKSPQRDWQTLGAAMAPRWSEERALALKARVEMRKKEQKWRSIAAVAVLFVVLFGVGALALWVRAPVSERTGSGAVTKVAAPSHSNEASPSLEPAAQALEPGTQFRVEEGVSTRNYHLIDGAVRFETRGSDKKALVVRVGALIIEDIGTIFTVETLPQERARVTVTEGRVRVSWSSGQQVLAARETGEFPPPSGKAAENDDHPKTDAASRTPAAPDWRVLARRGRYQQAFRILEGDPASVLNRVDDLLLAADVMRLSGRPNRAVGYLEQVVAHHSVDPRANLAAFTLGRVFLDELGRPLQAAHAFKTAGRGKSPLAEESLAREVEAWSRAGKVDRAQHAAMRYVRKYPKGARVDVVRAFGGLNAP